MRQEKLEYLQKKYESRLNPKEDAALPMGKAGMPGGPRHGGRGGKQNMAGGKPKNVKKTIGRLLGYISHDKWKLGIVCLCVIGGTVANLAGSYMLRPIINGLTSESGSTASLFKGILTMASIYLIAVLAQYLQQRIMIGISQNAIMNLRSELFGKLQKLPVRYYDTNHHGDIMSRFTNDVDAVGEMLNNTVVQLISGTINIVGTFSLMVYTNVWLTLITVVMIPVMLKAVQAVGGRSRKYYRAQQAAIGTLNGYIEETVTGQKVVKVFNHEEDAKDEFEYLNRDLRGKQIKAQFFGGIMGPVMGNLSQVSYSLTACIGGILCVLRGFDLGGLTVFVNYSRQFSRPINEVAMQVNTIFSALAGAERVFAVMDEEPEKEDEKHAVRIVEDKEQEKSFYVIPKESPVVKQEGFMEEVIREDETYYYKEVKGAVTLSHVTFGYNPDKTILKHISLYAKPGQKIAFVGSTGAGKTTITNLINRFYDIDEGIITIDQIPVTELERDSLRRNIAMVLQDTHLFTGTVRENIRYGRLDATDEEVEQAARTASAHSFIRRLEHGYDTMLEGDGANLSQGQRQLINIARAAISKAPILILDEATSSVDTRTEKHIEKGMDRLMATRTTLVIAHRLSTVRNANAIMVLENGEIIERGDHDDLLLQKGRYYELYTGLSELD
ncbi:MAG: ABC transporter ATP-binding protein/permease [Lachnospiraceae bacterium]|nr:ABC transporter ATP-binding protein/permease [Lachnospiraceae bacterium]MDE6183900.1 ABC transporter ATP-binding protein/permease [Lachnospiraceae bacterium]